MFANLCLDIAANLDCSSKEASPKFGLVCCAKTEVGMQVKTFFQSFLINFRINSVPNLLISSPKKGISKPPIKSSLYAKFS